MSKCFCHLTINGESYEVKDAKARESIQQLQNDFENFSPGDIPAELENRVVELEQKVATLEQDVDNTNKSIADIETLKADIETLKTQILALQSNQTGFTDGLELHDERLGALETAVAELQSNQLETYSGEYEENTGTETGGSGGSSN